MSKKYISESYLISILEVEQPQVKENIFKKIWDAPKKAVRDYREMRDNVKETNKSIQSTSNTIKALAGITFAYLAIKKMKDKYRSMKYGQCSKLSGKELTVCRIKHLNDMMGDLIAVRSQCNNSRDPEKCQIKINEELVKLNNKKKELMSKI